ncbi:hypothetical protein [Wolbachia endosymbiont (group B) of Idaea biselata]
MFANFNVVILYFYVHLYLWVIVRYIDESGIEDNECIRSEVWQG